MISDDIDDAEMERVRFLTGIILLSLRLNAEESDIPAHLVVQSMIQALVAFIVKNFSEEESGEISGYIVRGFPEFIKITKAALITQDASDAMGDTQGSA